MCAAAPWWTASKLCPPRLEQDTHQIDDGVGPRDDRCNARRVADVDAHRSDLADIAHRLQELGLFDVAHRDVDAVAGARQTTHEMAAEEAGAAEHGDQATYHLPPTRKRFTARLYTSAALLFERYRVEAAVWKWCASASFARSEPGETD